MTRLEKLIETLSERATDSDLLALLGTSREVRLYNGALARELREIVETLKQETDQRELPLLPRSNEIRLECRTPALRRGLDFLRLRQEHLSRPAEPTRR